MSRQTWARNADSAPDPGRKGETMNRGAQKLTPREAGVLKGLGDGWDTEVPGAEEFVDSDATDLWTYTIQRMKTDLEYHVLRAERATAEARSWKSAGASRHRACTDPLKLLQQEREFLAHAFPLLCVYLQIGRDAEARIFEDYDSLITQAAGMWWNLLRYHKKLGQRIRTRRFKARRRNGHRTLGY